MQGELKERSKTNSKKPLRNGGQGTALRAEDGYLRIALGKEAGTFGLCS